MFYFLFGFICVWDEATMLLMITTADVKLPVFLRLQTSTAVAQTLADTEYAPMHLIRSRVSVTQAMLVIGAR